MRARGKVDSNHSQIRDALRQVGVTVIDLSSVGDGCPDLAACFRGVWTMLEVKGWRGKLTDDQKVLHALCNIAVVRSEAEAFAAVGVAIR